MGSFDTGRALGQSAINASLDMKMQQQRQNMLQEELRMEREMKQQRLREETIGLQAAGDIMSEMGKLNLEGSLTSDKTVELMTSNPNVFRGTQGRQALDTATKLYQDGQLWQADALAKTTTAQDLVQFSKLTGRKGDPTTPEFRWFRANQKKANLYLEHSGESELPVDAKGEIDTKAVTQWYDKEGKAIDNIYGNWKVGSAIAVTDDSGKVVPGEYVVRTSQNGSVRISLTGANAKVQEQVAKLRGQISMVESMLTEADPKDVPRLEAMRAAKDAEIQSLLLNTAAEAENKGSSDGNSDPLNLFGR